ncbi:MAG: hypothetical protein ACI840_001295 [Ulvibacter sp.]|jgi:hypothetical protein
MKKILILLCFIVITISCNEVKESSEDIQSQENISEKKRTTAEAIAFKNGFENWEKVSEISFTFNVDRSENHFERSWSWKPKSQDILMIAGKDTVSYNRMKMDSIIKKTDASFINDKYWLLAPFNLIWDEGTAFTETQDVPAPISKEILNKLTVVYGHDGGYTPGDAYDFYFGKDFIIKEWTYRHANDSTPTMTNTWEDYEEFNGLQIAKMHKDSLGDFKLYFTNISVK